jgi:hypothetical protein
MRRRTVRGNVGERQPDIGPEPEIGTRIAAEMISAIDVELLRHRSLQCGRKK